MSTTYIHHYVHCSRFSLEPSSGHAWGFKTILPDIFSVNSVILSCRRAHRCGAAGAEKDKADVCSVHRLLAYAVMLSCSIHVVDFLAHAEFWWILGCQDSQGMWPCVLSVSTRRIHRICSLKIWRGLHAVYINERNSPDIGVPRCSSLQVAWSCWPF